MVSLLEAKKTIEKVLLLRNDVIGMGTDDSTQSIRVYVNQNKLDPGLSPIPSSMAGFPVEIIYTTGFSMTASETVAERNFREMRYRPVVAGVSATNIAATAGTVCAIVIDKKSGNKMVLSNNHVFANTTILIHTPKEGEPIVQPSPYDGGEIDDKFATLYRWVPFKDKEPNLVDAAIAMPVDQSLVSPYVLADATKNLLQIRGTKSVDSKIIVKKYGRTVAVDYGAITDFNCTISITCADNIDRIFTDQLLINMTSLPGDSGSLIMDDNNYAIGLLFAGGTDARGNKFTVANKIRNVLAMFGDDIDISDGLDPVLIKEPPPVLIVTDPLVIVTPTVTTDAKGNVTTTDAHGNVTVTDSLGNVTTTTDVLGNVETPDSQGSSIMIIAAAIAAIGLAGAVSFMLWRKGRQPLNTGG